jgi:hypothetical protein
MAFNETDGLGVPIINSSEKMDDELDLYIGVFFDGTNNNKYQVMIGKMFRWKEIYNKHKWTLKHRLKGWNMLDYSEVSPNTITSYPRSYWETGEGKDIFSRSELEYLYFGYDDINDPTSSNYNPFIEAKNIQALSGEDLYQLSSKPDDEKELLKLQDVADRIVNKNEGNGWLKDKWNGNMTDRAIKGAPAQNSTYTNVAILESLYKCGAEVNTESQKHVSLYIEGSGADMQIEASSHVTHTTGHGVLGLGKGTGPSGAVAKVRKAAVFTKRLINQFIPKDGSTRTLKIHFDICGFSRGATCARMFCYVINANKDQSNLAYSGDGAITGKSEDLELFTGSEKEFLPLNEPSGNIVLSEKEIRNLLIADTVASIGVIYKNIVENSITRGAANTLGGVSKGLEWVDNWGNRKVDEGTADVDMWGKRPYHYQNVDDYGLWATKLAKKVIHICAMDEVRQNFALTDLGEKIDNGIEVFIPGCHTDVGGGASIGLEEEKIINVGLNRYLTHYHVHKESELISGGTSHIMRVGEETLKTIGWLNKDSESAGFWHKTITGRSNRKTDETHYSDNSVNIVLYRHVIPGYSNIALNLFREKSNGEIFKPMPSAYNVPSALVNFYNGIMSYMDGTGRHFFYPQTQEMYYELRRQYLHFSFNEQLMAPADNLLVNGPEYADIFSEGDKLQVISRIIYTGDYNSANNSETRRHMFDYGDKVKFHTVPFSLN